MDAAQDTTSNTQIRHKRKWRNYLLDVGLQVRYTVFIIGIAILLTAGLGYKIYEATRDTSKVIFMTGLVDPSITVELQSQFRANDRVVLFGIVGFGLLLVATTFGAGIWMTHKVAGPLFNISMVFGRMRDNKLPAVLRQLRKGDELQTFYGSFKDMYDAVRARVQRDVEILGSTIAVLEKTEPKSPQLEETLAELRELRKLKEQSLDPPTGG
jgi:hypothetical protein